MNEMLESLRNPWILLGFAGQAVFSLRFLVQWIESERAGAASCGRVLVPVDRGSMLLLAYALWRRDVVFTLGQSMGFVSTRAISRCVGERRLESRALRSVRRRPGLRRGENVRPLADELAAALAALDCPGGDLRRRRQPRRTRKRVLEAVEARQGFRLVPLDRNQGQSLRSSPASAPRHSHVATLDGDLQNDPSDVPRVVALARDHDVVIAGAHASRHPLASARGPPGQRVRRAALGDGASDTGCSLKLFPTRRSSLSRASTGCTASCPRCSATRGFGARGRRESPRAPRGSLEVHELARLRRTSSIWSALYWLSKRTIRIGARDETLVVVSAGAERQHLAGEPGMLPGDQGEALAVVQRQRSQVARERFDPRLHDAAPDGEREQEPRIQLARSSPAERPSAAAPAAANSASGSAAAAATAAGVSPSIQTKRATTRRLLRGRRARARSDRSQREREARSQLARRGRHGVSGAQREARQHRERVVLLFLREQRERREGARNASAAKRRRGSSRYRRVVHSRQITSGSKRLAGAARTGSTERYTRARGSESIRRGPVRCPALEQRALQ